MEPTSERRTKLPCNPTKNSGTAPRNLWNRQDFPGTLPTTLKHPPALKIVCVGTLKAQVHAVGEKYVQYFPLDFPILAGTPVPTKSSKPGRVPKQISQENRVTFFGQSPFCLAYIQTFYLTYFLTFLLPFYLIGSLSDIYYIIKLYLTHLRSTLTKKYSSMHIGILSDTILTF